MSIHLRRFYFASVAVLLLAACSSQSPPSPKRAMLPQSTSPALVKPAPMRRTAILPASAMHSPRSIDTAILPPSWTPLPGSATQVAAAPDGSLWVLSQQPSGADKYIWHYAGGAWTNISGEAAHLAVAPNGTLYAVNAGGGTYAYSGGNWTALGGGARAITIAADGSVYVLSNAGPGPNYAIWRNSGGTWTQVPGEGVALAASWDSGSYTTPGGAINAGGVYVLNSDGPIYYANTNGAYASLPGAAAAVAPTKSGGLFALGYSAGAFGNEPLYYYDLDAPGWSTEKGSGVSISTDGTTLYVVSESGAIYESPISSAAPVSVNPSSLTFSSSTALTFTASESNFTGTLAESDTCSGMATVSPASASGPSAVFTVTPVANGQCSITISGASGQQATVSVTISGVSFVIQRSSK